MCSDKNRGVALRKKRERSGEVLWCFIILYFLFCVARTCDLSSCIIRSLQFFEKKNYKVKTAMRVTGLSSFDACTSLD